MLAVVGNFAVEGVASHRDSQLSEVVQEVTGQPELGVHCRRWWDNVLNFSAKPGYVEWGSDTAQLAWSVCADALRWAENTDEDDTRLAVMVVTHEAAHLVGHRNEAETECVAMWAVDRTTVALGGSAEDGASIARWYQVSYNPLLRGDYLAPRCLSNPPPPSSITR